MLSKKFNLIVQSKIPSYKKTISVDSDKSISIRSLLIGSICHSVSNVRNVLESEDIFSTVQCLKKLGVKIDKIKSNNYLIYGKGLGSLKVKKKHRAKLWKLRYTCEVIDRNIIYYTKCGS